MQLESKVKELEAELESLNKSRPRQERSIRNAKAKYRLTMDRIKEIEAVLKEFSKK
jgi:hypothetical protein